METIYTHTGKIFVDREKQLEFLTVGDYGKENNIKANFLGLTKEIKGVKNTVVDLHKEWVATISTQKGCPMKCKFCDCPRFGFYGNVSHDDLAYQIRTILRADAATYWTDRFNVHFARMGEPTFNREVLNFTDRTLRKLVHEYINAKTIHPVVSTMLPKDNKDLMDYLLDWCFIKNHVYSGEAGLQFSINSTDDFQRNAMFNGMSHSIEAIAKMAEQLPHPVGRKYTLNFAVTKDTILDAKKLDDLFDRNHWIVKLTPIHETRSAVDAGFDVGDTYTDFIVYRKFELPLLALGWDVIVFVPSLEEDSDRITCGNALIASGGERCTTINLETRSM